jgi:pilus assembly protein CpaC
MRVAQRDIPTPVDGFRPATDVERMLGQRIGRTGKAPGPNAPASENGLRLQGDAGFYY